MSAIDVLFGLRAIGTEDSIRRRRTFAVLLGSSDASALPFRRIGLYDSYANVYPQAFSSVTERLRCCVRYLCRAKETDYLSAEGRAGTEDPAGGMTLVLGVPEWDGLCVAFPSLLGSPALNLNCHLSSLLPLHQPRLSQPALNPPPSPHNVSHLERLHVVLVLVD